MTVGWQRVGCLLVVPYTSVTSLIAVHQCQVAQLRIRNALTFGSCMMQPQPVLHHPCVHIKTKVCSKYYVHNVQLYSPFDAYGFTLQQVTKQVIDLIHIKLNNRQANYKDK